MFDDRVLFTLQREKALGKLLGHMTSNSHGLLQLNRSLVNFTKTYDHTTKEVTHQRLTMSLKWCGTKGGNTPKADYGVKWCGAKAVQMNVDISILDGFTESTQVVEEGEREKGRKGEREGGR